MCNISIYQSYETLMFLFFKSKAYVLYKYLQNSINAAKHLENMKHTPAPHSDKKTVCLQHLKHFTGQVKYYTV